MRRKKQSCLIAATLLLVTALEATSTHATTLARLSLEQLATAADSVARVHCVSSDSRWEDDAIWTVTTFSVVETIKGNLPRRVTVRLPGGRVGHLTATVDGTPKFNPGTEALVFLERSRSGEFTVAGWVQGTFRMGRDPLTLHETVTQDSSAFAVFDTATRSFHAEGVRKMPLEQFRARVATAIARQQEKTR